MIRNTVETIVISALRELGASTENEGLAHPSPTTRLFGKKGLLDSLGMINLILELEETLFEEFEVNIVIADEKALSQKRSPFKDVTSLVDYITTLLDDVGDGEGGRHALGQTTHR